MRKDLGWYKWLSYLRKKETAWRHVNLGLFVAIWCLSNTWWFLLQDVKNEAEAYMLKELSLLKWQEKATKLALDDTGGKMDELQGNVATLEESLKAER